MKLFKESLAEFMQDPEFKAEWDALEPEYEVYRAAAKDEAKQEDISELPNVRRVNSSRRNTGLQARP